MLLDFGQMLSVGKINNLIISALDILKAVCSNGKTSRFRFAYPHIHNKILLLLNLNVHVDGYCSRDALMAADPFLCVSGTQ